MVIVLDTSVVIEFERENEKIIKKLADLRNKISIEPVITSAVYSELITGYLKKNKKVPFFISQFEIINFDKNAAEIFAKKKKELEIKGKMIPLFDLITASCAISNNAILVTVDKHFKNVHGLKKIIL